MSEHEQLVAGLQLVEGRFEDLRDAATTAESLRSGACAGCDATQCTMGVAAPSGASCAAATCTGVCTELAELFAPIEATAATTVARCQSAAQQVEMAELLTLYQTQQDCVGCCLLDAPDCVDLAGASITCDTSTCDGVTTLYANISRVFGECPSEMPGELRFATVTATLQAAASAKLREQFVSPLAADLSALQLPPLVRNCVDNLTQQFAVPTTKYNDITCAAETDELALRMNGWLDVARKFTTPKPGGHLIFKFVMFVACLILIFASYKNKTYAEGTVSGLNDNAEWLEAHVKRFKTKALWAIGEEGWKDGEPGGELLDGYEEHAVPFKPVLSDFKRFFITYLAADGGNLATVDELKQLSNTPEVHVLTNFNKAVEREQLRKTMSEDTESTPDPSDLGDGVSDQAREVLCNGSTAINFLVWRRSAIRVGMVALVLSLVNDLNKMYQISANWDGVVVDADGAPVLDDSGREIAVDADGAPDLFGVISGHVNTTCYLLCQVQGLVGRGDVSQEVYEAGGDSNHCSELCDDLVTVISGTDEKSCPAAPGVIEPEQVNDSEAPGLVSSWSYWLSYKDADQNKIDDATGEPTGRSWMKMKDKFNWYKELCEAVKFVVVLYALVLFRQAEAKWTDVKESSALVARGWSILFATPLLLSVVPWYLALDFPAEMEGEGLLAQVPGYIKGVSFKFKLGTATYLQTQAVALALCKSAMIATVQCKMLVPRSGLWTQAFFLVPMLTVVLQWPLFGTDPRFICLIPVPAQAFLLRLTCLPFALACSARRNTGLILELLVLPDRVYACADLLPVLRDRDRPRGHPRQIAQSDHARQEGEQVHKAAGSLLFLYGDRALGDGRPGRRVRGQGDRSRSWIHGLRIPRRRLDVPRPVHVELYQARFECRPRGTAS